MKILVIDGHPYEKGLASVLASAYVKGAKTAGHQVRHVKLRELHFDPILRFGYRKVMKLEEDLLAVQQDLLWCQRLVIATPIWWMGMPALLKGFIDRVFLPKFAFSFGKRKYLPKGLFRGKSFAMIYTQGAPKWLTKLAFFDAHWLLMKYGTFKFVGFGPITRFSIGRADKISEQVRQREIAKAVEFGKKAKK